MTRSCQFAPHASLVLIGNKSDMQHDRTVEAARAQSLADEYQVHSTQTTNHKPQTTNHKPQTTNYKLQTANRKPQTANRKPQTANRKPQTANHNISTSKQRPQTSNHKPQALSFETSAMSNLHVEAAFLALVQAVLKFDPYAVRFAHVMLDGCFIPCSWSQTVSRMI